LEKKKTAWYYIKNTLYYAFIIVLVFIIAVSLFIPQGLVKVVGFGWYRVVSNSMEPLIMVDDYIIVTKIDDINTLEEGDIIVFETYFYHNGSYSKDVVTHHFGGFDEEGYVKTYPHKEHDKEVKQYDVWRKSAGQIYNLTVDDLIGIHVTTVQSSGFISFLEFLFTTPIGIGVVIINLGVIYGIYFIVRSSKKEKEQQLLEAVNEDSNEETSGDDANDMGESNQDRTE